MSIETIFNFIDNKNYISNDEINFNNFFKGDFNDYLKYKKNLINIFKEKYKNKYLFPTDYSIIIEDDIYRIFIKYHLENNNEIFWTIKIL